ncbi:signal peptidase II [Croceitalea rosinachiae]|uniref:Lipoprotein signal peptidase n=1 Tax=Croceitalea rosinachiae TaxID=3075596 RepID=A0ABU3ABP0_9FLAO|nr:signal peptidase II [Croceitalea sp. F388]MDT0607323.1 signal peptidase II [Croceitalea sp. F388]
MTRKILVVLLILSNISCDQISKKIVRKSVNSNSYIQVLNDNFVLTKIENTGAALGLGENLSPNAKKVFLNILPALVLLFLTYRVLTHKKINTYSIIAFSFIIGGGIGNIIDRFLYGSVTDFLHLKFGFLKTGIFNLADVSVTLGAITILFLSLLKKNEI